MPASSFRIAEVALRVRDLEKMTAFYTEVVGFTFHKNEPHVVFLSIGDDGGPLAKVGHPQLLALFNRIPDVSTEKSTFDHIAFEVPPGEYDAEYARYQAMDMIISERAWPDTLPWNGRSFFFRDPEGNIVEIITANPT